MTSSRGKVWTILSHQSADYVALTADLRAYINATRHREDQTIRDVIMKLANKIPRRNRRLE